MKNKPKKAKTGQNNHFRPYSQKIFDFMIDDFSANILKRKKLLYGGQVSDKPTLDEWIDYHIHELNDQLTINILNNQICTNLN